MIGLKLYVGNSLPWGFLLLNLITMCFSLLLSCHFPGSLCGNRKFQQMSLFFLWTVVLGRILTVDNLWWAFSLFGVHWVLRGFLLIGWASLAGIRLWWFGVWSPCCLMWGIWSERSIHDLMLSFFNTLFEWTNALEVFTFTSLPDLLDNCTFHTKRFIFFCLLLLIAHLPVRFGPWLIVFTHLFFFGIKCSVLCYVTWVCVVFFIGGWNQDCLLNIRGWIGFGLPQARDSKVT